MGFTLVGALLIIPFILAYTAWSYYVFRGKVKAGEGYHWWLLANGGATFRTDSLLATSHRMADPDLDSQRDGARARGGPVSDVDERCGADHM